jgi:hypothetical protein
MGRYDSDTGLFSTSEFKGRGVIKLAPDALVYLNGTTGSSFVAPITGSTGKTDFGDGISSINIQNNVDPPGSSTATIEIATPIYNEKSSYWRAYKDGTGQSILKSVFTPMMEVQIYFKGRFLVGKNPRYYSAFWGFVTNVEESYSNGLYKTQLQCADMLHWWQYIQVAFRPSVESNIFAKHVQGLTAFGSRYEMANPFEIMYSLCKEMGIENFITPAWLGKLTPNSKTQNPDPRIVDIYEKSFKYWNERFAGLYGNNLLRMYGAAGRLIEHPNMAVTYDPVNKPIPEDQGFEKSQLATNTGVDEPFDMLDKIVGKFQVFHEFDQMKSLDQAEYKTKLEIATELKNRIQYEFFQDVTGNFIFKPPFFNLNTQSLTAYNIKPQDIISFSSAINSEEIITALEVHVSPQQNIRDTSWINIVGYHVDTDLVMKYGYRHKKIDSWWLSESALAQSYSVGEMGLINAKAYTGSVTIPGRPELRLGYPVYVTHKDAFYYVKSINHAFDYGGSFSTTLSLEAERIRVYSNDTIQKNMVYKYVIESQEDAELKRKISDIEKVLKQQNEYNQYKINEQRKAEIKAEEASFKQGKKVPVKSPEIKEKTFEYDGKDPKFALEDLLREKGMTSSLIPGRYELVTSTDSKQQSITDETIPYTDEWGYRVIGAFRYGRGISVRPGKVVESNEIFLDQAYDPSLLVEENVATNIVTMATEEGNSMAAYFATNNQLGIEAAVVPYFKFSDDVTVPPQSPPNVANMLISMIPGGANRDSDSKLLPPVKE